MIVREISAIEPETIERLLHAIPFYKSVQQQDQHQYEQLLRYSRILHYQTNDPVLMHGQFDPWSYFLVRGQLVVSLKNDHGQRVHINTITPGEVFGDLAMLVGRPRTADVHVASDCREAVMFGTDFSLFGELDNFLVVSLPTKLLYYRHATHSLRWKLEVYRSKYPQHSMSSKHLQVQLYTGPKDCLQELYALFRQARELAELLIEWNQCFGSLSFVSGSVSTSGLAV